MTLEACAGGLERVREPLARKHGERCRRGLTPPGEVDWAHRAEWTCHGQVALKGWSAMRLT